jgi:hypothetical protein
MYDYECARQEFLALTKQDTACGTGVGMLSIELKRVAGQCREDLLHFARRVWAWRVVLAYKHLIEKNSRVHSSCTTGRMYNPFETIR